MKPIRLYESLFILYKCNRTINLIWPIINAHQNDIYRIREIGVVLTNHIKMESISFLDEFKGAFFHKIEDLYKPRMQDVRQITAPIIKRIKKWKDLEKFRNNIIAHAWRDKGKFVIPDPEVYNIPKSWFEVSILVNLMNYLWQLIEAEFKKELNECLIYVTELMNLDKEVPEMDSSDQITKLNSDHFKMAQEVDAICQQLKRPYFLKVLQYQEES